MICALFEKFGNIVPITGYSEDSLSLGNYVVVETSRGTEIARLVKTKFEKPLQKGAEIKLKKLIRYANDEDMKNLVEIRNKERELIKDIKIKLSETEPPIKILDGELIFDKQKMIVYYKLPDVKTSFSSKQLAKELSNEFNIKIELYSLNAREQARLKSGYGPCGRKVCCCSFLLEFPHVSVKLLKEQGISLNQSKILGLCGKFLCCLKYEQNISNDSKEGNDDN